MEIRNNCWVYLSFSEAIEKISTNKKKIKQKEYLEIGKIPIVDQGQQLIRGYTNDENKALDCELPVIVFGDHTKVVKFINFKFASGADGVKVIKPLNCFNPKLFAYFLQVLARKIPDKGYARHFQFLEKEIIPVPPLKEQQAIVQEIESRFSVVDKLEQIIDESLQKAEALRQSILKKAFKGKLTRKWREEHPELISGENSAEALLERIKAEKAKISANNKKKKKGKKKLSQLSLLVEEVLTESGDKS